MIRHAISYGARTFAWPSMQEASLMLVERIDFARGVEARERYDEWLAGAA